MAGRLGLEPRTPIQSPGEGSADKEDQPAKYVADLIPRRFELGVLAIHEVAVLDAVAIHRRKAVDISLLGDSAGFGGSDIRLGACHGEGDG